MADWIYIDSALDDLGLTPQEFRVYAHLSRRYNKELGYAWPSGDSIAKTCRMHADTVWPTLKRLEARGLISRETVKGRHGRENHYRILRPSPNAPSTGSEGSTPQAGLPEKEGRPIPDIEGRPLPGLEGWKGTPCKVIQKGNPKEPLASERQKGGSSNGTPKPRQRDPLFDALAVAGGSDPIQLTKPAMKSIGVALAAIKGACPDVTPEEIHARASKYRAIHPKWPLTHHALANHWAQCGKPPKPPLPQRGWILECLIDAVGERCWRGFVESAGLTDFTQAAFGNAALEAYNKRRLEVTQLQECIRAHDSQTLFAIIGFKRDEAHSTLTYPPSRHAPCPNKSRQQKDNE